MSLDNPIGVPGMVAAANVIWPVMYVAFPGRSVHPASASVWLRPARRTAGLRSGS